MLAASNGLRSGAAEKCAIVERVLWAPRVVLPSGTVPAAVHIHATNGKIAAAWPCSRDDAARYADEHGVQLEALTEAEVISPGIVDAAAHLAEWLDAPGRTYEGFFTGTQAAAAGGVTTVVDLPAHAWPVTTTSVHLRRKMDASRGRLHVDVGFWAAALPESIYTPELRELLAHGGALGLSAVFAASPNLSEVAGYSPATRALTLAELEAVADLAAEVDRPVLVHSEAVSDDDAGLPAGSDGMDYASWLATRPTRWEEGAVRALLAIASKPRPTRAPRLHVLRLTDAGCTMLLSEAAATHAIETGAPRGKPSPLPVSASTCPHYVMFDAEGVVRGDTRLKVAPPLRSGANRRKLWEALLDGSIQMIVSDHTPATLEERAGSFFDAFTGIAGLQFTLPATWTEGRDHGARLEHLARWLSEEPARLAGLWRTKGSIEPRKDADLVIWRPDARTETAAVFHRQPGSPYEDMTLVGRVVETVVRGRIAFRDGTPPAATCGRILVADSAIPAAAPAAAHTGTAAQPHQEDQQHP